MTSSVARLLFFLAGDATGRVYLFGFLGFTGCLNLVIGESQNLDDVVVFFPILAETGFDLDARGHVDEGLQIHLVNIFIFTSEVSFTP